MIEAQESLVAAIKNICNRAFPTITSMLTAGLRSLNEAMIGIKKWRSSESVVVTRSSPTCS